MPKPSQLSVRSSRIVILPEMGIIDLHYVAHNGGVRGAERTARMERPEFLYEIIKTHISPRTTRARARARERFSLLKRREITTRDSRESVLSSRYTVSSC